MEYINIYNDKGMPLGYQKERNRPLSIGEYAIVVHIWIINSEGKLLVQQRASTKKVDPYLWSITAGFVDVGENSLDTVKRELKEEIDEKLTPDNVVSVFRLFPKKGNQHIVDVYVLKMDVDLSTLILQAEEVNDIDFWTKEQILENVKTGVFKDFDTMYDYYFERVFEVIK